MRIEDLDEHIRALAKIEPSEAPAITCYMDVSGGPVAYRALLDRCVLSLRRSLPWSQLDCFEDALAQIEDFLKTGIAAVTRGIAVFARGGRLPLFRALQFEVPLPNWITVDSKPNIYHLVELRDNYDRYVIFHVTETSTRIIGVNLGSVTDQIWKARPELRRRAGRGWARDHFQDHQRQRSNQFIHDQFQSLARVMAKGGYGHLLLAGSMRALALVRRALPKSLAAKLVDVLPASTNDRVSDVVASSLCRFLKYEELQSQAIAERLAGQVCTRGLAVAGTEATIQALKSGQVDVLVIAKNYDLGDVWECRRCGRIETRSIKPDACPACRNRILQRVQVRSELVRLAGRLGCSVEVVEHSDALMNLGGVGCLLRFLAPDRYISQAA